MHFSNDAIVTWLLFIIMVLIWNVDVATSEESKCSQPHRINFETCSLDYKRMAMWCDSTNITTVPHHKSSIIETQTPAVRAKRIHLNNSCVSGLDPVLLGHYKDLIVFNCDDNEVTEIQSNTFSGNTNLEELTLSDNRISNLDQSAFKGLSKLVSLNLRENRLTRIRKNDFRELFSLNTLDLSRNKIDMIHENAFMFTRNLEVINLEGNCLKTVNEFLFSGLIKLTSLNLASNHLRNPGSGLFHSSTMISNVDFSNNNITCIPKSLFKGRTSVSVFRISNNTIKTPQPEWYRSVWDNRQSHLIGSDFLKNNPWTCDCDSHRYWDFLSNEVTEEDWRESLDVECSFPLHLRGEKLSSLKDDFFTECTVTLQECSKDQSEAIHDGQNSNLLGIEKNYALLQELSMMEMTTKVEEAEKRALNSFEGSTMMSTTDRPQRSIVLLLITIGFCIVVVVVSLFGCVRIRRYITSRGKNFRRLPNQSKGSTRDDHHKNETNNNADNDDTTIDRSWQYNNLSKTNNRDSGLGDDVSYKSNRQRTLSAGSDVSERQLYGVGQDGGQTNSHFQTNPKVLISPSSPGSQANNLLPTIHETLFGTPLQEHKDPLLESKQDNILRETSQKNLLQTQSNPLQKPLIRPSSTKYASTRFGQNSHS